MGRGFPRGRLARWLAAEDRQGAGGPSARGILRASSWAATGVTCASFYWGTWAAAEAELFDW